MCKSKTRYFSARASRGSAVMRAGGASHLSGAVDLGAGGPSAHPRRVLRVPRRDKNHTHRGGGIEPARNVSDVARTRAETARVAREALEAMEELAAADAAAAAWRRTRVIEVTRDSSRDPSLDGDTRARLRVIHARLIEAVARDEGR